MRNWGWDYWFWATVWLWPFIGLLIMALLQVGGCISCPACK